MASGDKFTINEGQPYMLPHSCVSCNTSKNTTYIDWGRSVPKYGRLYFCDECFDECAVSMGYISPVSKQEMINDHQFERDELHRLREENVKLRHLVDSGIKQFRDDIYGIAIKPQSVDQPIKRSPGRPKRSEQRVA